MTTRKKWPHAAAWARDDAIMEASEALREIERLLDGEMDMVEVLRVLALVVMRLNRVVAALKAVRSE